MPGASGCARFWCCWPLAPAGTKASSTSMRPPSSSSFTPPPCCTTTWWTAPPCAAGERRRTRYSAIATSVLVGDFLYSRAFQMMVALDRMPIMHIIADATNAIAEGEVLQLMNAHDPNTSEERYIDVIRRKTARLFQAGAQIGAVLCDASAPHRGFPRPIRQAHRHRFSAGGRCARLSGRGSQPRETSGG